MYVVELHASVKGQVISANEPGNAALWKSVLDIVPYAGIKFWVGVNQVYAVEGSCRRFFRGALRRTR